jgi:hypothetical protein
VEEEFDAGTSDDAFRAINFRRSLRSTDGLLSGAVMWYLLNWIFAPVNLPGDHQSFFRIAVARFKFIGAPR